MKFTRRAERVEEEKLVATFVDAEPLLASLSTQDNQVIYGRRGTGKTHVIKYLSEKKTSDGDVTLFIDLRSIGSNGSIYSDYSRTIPQRATPLLLDVLQEMHNELLSVAIGKAEELDLSITGPLLDELAASISQVRVEGTTEASSEEAASLKQSSRTSLGLQVSPAVATGAISSEFDNTSERAKKSTIRRTGTEQYYVNFGTVQNCLSVQPETN